MVQEIAYCEVCKSSNNIRGPNSFLCKVCNSNMVLYIKKSDYKLTIDYKSDIAAKNSEIAAKNLEIAVKSSEISAKNFEVQNLKNNFAGQLHDEKEFMDVKIVYNEKTLDGHKAVLSCRSEVLKTIIRNKSLIEKQAAVMEINETDFNYETMEQVFFLFLPWKC